MLTADSSPWPCEFSGAQYEWMEVPKEAPPPSPPGILIAKADLLPNEIQDLADEMGEITAAAAGNELIFT